MHKILTVILIVGFCSVATIANAAKIHVHGIAPTTNTDGSPLTDLKGFRIEWGTCNSDGSFGTYQAGINIGGTILDGWIYPTGLSKVCARAFAINSANVLSAASNTASAIPPPTLSKPTQP